MAHYHSRRRRGLAGPEGSCGRAARGLLRVADISSRHVHHFEPDRGCLHPGGKKPAAADRFNLEIQALFSL